MIKTIIIDTNIIVRYLIQDHPEHYEVAKGCFELVRLGKIKAYLEQTVFTETIFVLSNIYSVPREAVANTLYDFLMYKGIYNEDKAVLLKSLDIYANTKLHIVDCVLAAKSKMEQIEIKTFDKELLNTLKNLK